MELTSLGKGIFNCNLPPEEGLIAFLDLKRANSKVVLSTNLHLLYLLTPIQLDFRIDWVRLNGLYNKLSPLERSVADLIGLSQDMILMMSTSQSN